MSEEAVQAAEEQKDIVEEVKEPAMEIVAAESSSEVAETPVAEDTAPPEDVSFHTVEKEGSVTAIWEMQGQKHLRTIDPRSIEGKQILALFETAG